MGVEKVTNGKMSGVLALVLMLVLGLVGMAIIQDAFNNVEDTGAAAPLPPAQPTAV
jgi:predicted ATP-grasp superfamily ATP-dependent carboligase